jgi:GTP-binding protein
MGREVDRPKVALIGRPNVGKSTLFNRLIGREQRKGGRAAIVDELPGVTRDRLYGLCEWDGYEFSVIDCGGIGEESEDPLRVSVAENSFAAMQESDLVLFICDGRSGMTLSDDAVLKELRRTDKPVIVAVNKVDSDKQEADAYEFYKLGYKDVQFIAALSGRMVDELLDLVIQRLDWSRWERATPAHAAWRYETAEDEAERRGSAAPAGADTANDENYPFAWAELGGERFVPEENWRDQPIRLVFVGRQNVGKSSLTNALLGSHRSLVADLPGTTRDPLYAEFEHEGQAFELMDTAGIKRVTRMKEDVDFYSLIRAEKSLRGGEVALLTIDVTEGLVEQDRRVASTIAEMARAVVIVANKADQLADEEAARALYTDYIRRELARLAWTEIVYTSATERQGLGALLAAATRSRENFHRRIDNAALKAVMEEAVTLSPPPIVKNRELRFFDFRQIGNCPPTFLIEVNDRKAMRQAYRRFLENTIRRHFDFDGTHIQLVYYEKRRRKRR